MSKRTICVDFDGVIHSYTTPWVKAHIIPDAPVEGAIEWLSQMIQHFEVVIFSTRCKTAAGRRAMRTWLQVHTGQSDFWWHTGRSGTRGLEEITYSCKKLPGLIYLDDRAVRFEGPGSFPSKDAIYRLRPWNKPEAPQGEIL